MKTLLKYDIDNFKISQTKWDKNYTAKTESMMALGNGYLGVRSVDEEVEGYNKEDLFVNGIFNKEHKDEVSELANLADLIQTPIYIDGIRFSLSESDKYTKTLDINRGILTREVKAKRGSKEFTFTFERFVSQDNQHLYAQRITILQTKGEDAKIEIHTRINGQTTNSGAQHLKEGLKKRVTHEAIQYFEKTTWKDLLVAHNLSVKVKNGKIVVKGGNDDFVLTMARRQVGFKIVQVTKKGTPLVIEKLMTVNTSIDTEKAQKSEQVVLDRAADLMKDLLTTSFDAELKKSDVKWKDIWAQFFIEIKGANKDAKYDLMANKFGIFHMNSFVPKDNDNLSVGAKGLSGEGYQGHAFWDTEFFIVPNYLFTNTQIAKNLLVYRYKGIEGARAKAAETKERKEESNLKGAQYPWEMAWPTDGEVCPYWGQADVVTGQQVPIASRRQEIHVPADVAYAVHQYYNFTKDEKFMNDMGYEMIIDTAIFWSNRAEKQKSGLYEIKDVMGPNEYKGNIDNNAYINAFAKYNLQLALMYIEKLSSSASGKKTLDKVMAKIPYEVNVKKLQEVYSKLVQQQPNAQGIIAENDQFLQLPKIDVSPFQLLGDAGKKLFSTAEGHKRLCSQLVKQADVVLLTLLLPHWFDKKVIDKNFDYYEPLTTHDSSLSPTTYAIQAVELRKMKLAYKLYKYSLNIDMGPNMKSCDAGIHAGSLAAIWQSTIYGYGGLRWYNDELHLSPILPKEWEGLKYRVQYQGALIEVSVGKKEFKVHTLNDKKIKMNVNGVATTIDSKVQSFKIVE